MLGDGQQALLASHHGPRRVSEKFLTVSEQGVEVSEQFLNTLWDYDSFCGALEAPVGSWDSPGAVGSPQKL